MKLLPRICIFFGALAFASFAISANAAPPKVISSLPFFITVPGKYVLKQNFTLSAATAIIITCGDVIVDLDGYTITGPGDTGPKSAGIVAASLSSASLSNIIVKNGTLANLQAGVSFFPSTGPVGVTDSVIRNITLMEYTMQFQILKASITGFNTALSCPMLIQYKQFNLRIVLTMLYPGIRFTQYPYLLPLPIKV